MTSALLIKMSPTVKGRIHPKCLQSKLYIEIEVKYLILSVLFKLLHRSCGLHTILSNTPFFIRGCSYKQPHPATEGTNYILDISLCSEIKKKEKKKEEEEKDGILTVQLVCLLLGKQIAKRKKPSVSLSFRSFSGEAELVLKQWKHCSSLRILCCPRWMTDIPFFPHALLVFSEKNSFSSRGWTLVSF